MQIVRPPIRVATNSNAIEPRAQSSQGSQGSQKSKPSPSSSKGSRGGGSALTASASKGSQGGKPAWKSQRQPARLEQEKEALEDSRTMKRTAQITPHRTEQQYVMAGNALTLKPRYQVDAQQLASMKQETKSLEKRPSIKPRTPRAAELAAARRAAKSASKSGRQSSVGSAARDSEERTSFLLTQADPAAVPAPDNTPRPPDSDRQTHPHPGAAGGPVTGNQGPGNGDQADGEPAKTPPTENEEETKEGDKEKDDRKEEEKEEGAEKVAGDEEKAEGEGGEKEEGGGEEERDEGGEEKAEVNGVAAEVESPEKEETAEGGSVPSGTAVVENDVTASAVTGEEGS